MTRLPPALRTLLLAGAAAIGAPSWAAANSSLQPYQMVRSLQVIQDRLADGDHAALPMQRKVLEMIDARLRAAPAEDFADRRNFRALLIYGMSGGNPSTLRAALSRLQLEDADKRLGGAIVDYLQGNGPRALKTLQEIDTSSQSEEVEAFLSLVMGSVVIAEKPNDGFAHFDRARLLAPGTLVEEAALRRTVSLAAQQQKADRFLSAAEQYVRRFLRSPYASNFADSFVAGVLQLHDTIDLPSAATVIAGMSPDQGRVVYLRIARRAAIERHERLVEFARTGLAGAEIPAEGKDPRELLYEGLASITSDQIGDVKQNLSAIDPSRLSANDRRLLDAAMSLVTDVTAAPVATSPSPRADESATPAPSAAPGVAPEAVETLVETRPPSEEPAPELDETATSYVSAARQRLEEVDRLLGGPAK